jgi:DNA-binding transcriptional ArsR family regulator
MDNKGTNNVLVRSDILINNDDYFKYIFKKTEKIIGAVFYMTRGFDESTKKDTLIELVEDRSMHVSVIALETLTAPRHTRVTILEELRGALVALESGLGLLVVSGLMREDLLEVFRQEMNVLGRSLRDYLYEYPRHPFEVEGEESGMLSEKRRVTRRMVASPRDEQSGSVLQHRGVVSVSRRDRVLSIIKDKGQVTIKDVSTAITDVSEKTIQRVLTSLVAEGAVLKEGERRWSRYSIIKQ